MPPSPKICVTAATSLRRQASHSRNACVADLTPSSTAKSSVGKSRSNMNFRFRRSLAISEDKEFIDGESPTSRILHLFVLPENSYDPVATYIRLPLPGSDSFGAGWPW